MTKKEFMEALLIIESFGFKAENLEKIQLTVWFESIKDLDYTKVKRALVEIAKTKTSWFDTDNPPAIIRQAVKNLPKERKFWKAPAKWVEMRDQSRLEWEEKQKLLKHGEGNESENSVNRIRTKRISGA